MGVLARASADELEAAWAALTPTPPVFRYLRRPETGMVMVRGRIGGTGQRFNLGEITVTRCTIALANGTVGTAYVAGGLPRATALAAVFDALLQTEGPGGPLATHIVAPMAQTQADRRHAAAAKAAATKVDFFTLVRGS